MFADRGMGQFARCDYGEAICPHCTKTFKKVTENQITCAKQLCKNEQRKKLRHAASPPRRRKTVT